MKSNKRRVLRWLALALLLPALWFAADAAYVSIGAETDHAAPADVIIVLGCNPRGETGPSPCMQARAGHAADLYKEGYSKHIIATGNPRESRVLQSVLEGAGVPPGAIVSDSSSYNTIQNITNSQAIMLARGWHSAILVTEPFHIKRSALIARDVWGQDIPIYPSPAIDSQNWHGFYAKAYNVSRDALSLMLYQVKALVGQRN
jgi:uncharacterized SAM-binding protein YcdF (DUF218 family)